MSKYGFFSGSYFPAFGLDTERYGVCGPCELKIIYNVTASIRFFQDNIYERNDFAAKFSIHIFPDPRPFKYYNYFDFFDFFEFDQAKKTDYILDVGKTFHWYLLQTDTKLVTTFEKFTDKNGKYKGVIILEKLQQ